MEKLVAMLIICWVPQSNETMKEAWRIEKTVTLDHCLTMNEIAGGGGKFGVIVVHCPRQHGP